MIMMQIAECNFLGFEESNKVLDVIVPDSLETMNVNLYLQGIAGEENKLSYQQFETLIELLERVYDNGYDINDLLKIASCAGNKQVVYEHHLRSVRE